MIAGLPQMRSTWSRARIKHVTIAARRNLKSKFFNDFYARARARRSPKGSLKVWDDETVLFADIASPGTMRNLRSYPFIEINLVDPFLRRGFRFKGRAEVCESGPELSRRGIRR